MREPRVIDKFRTAQTNAKNGFRVLWLHYTCDPEKDPSTAEGKLWFETTKVPFGPNEWRREYEIDFQAHVGLPVYPHFDRAKHVADIAPDPSLPLIRGWDPGYRVAACVFCQVVDGWKLRVFDELEGFQGSMREFGEAVQAHTAANFPQWYGSDRGIEDYIDLAGTQHSQTSESTAIDILATLGIHAGYKRSGKKERIHLVSSLLAMEDGFKIHPRCSKVLSGLNGLYRYPEKRIGNKTADLPEETEVIHCMHAKEYAAIHTVVLPVAPTERKPATLLVNLRTLIFGPQPAQAQRSYREC